MYSVIYRGVSIGAYNNEMDAIKCAEELAEYYLYKEQIHVSTGLKKIYSTKIDTGYVNAGNVYPLIHVEQEVRTDCQYVWTMQFTNPKGKEKFIHMQIIGEKEDGPSLIRMFIRRVLLGEYWTMKRIPRGSMS